MSDEDASHSVWMMRWYRVKRESEKRGFGVKRGVRDDEAHVYASG